MAAIDLETTQNQARKLLRHRIASVTELAKARPRRDQLSEQVKEAERENKRAHARARRDGWSEEELKKLGLDETGGVRRRTRRAANTA
ncbi:MULTISPECIES: hypothetical protein [Paenarthrobacter]|uniref:Uncharacterized protein n=1 Tax=Paenarthrobacter ureafaciens TaxID=37931 RepID=A0AAX3EFX6_PAEUR|nr:MULTISPECIES: hypothetical protein [Paenarthrobacter]NKR13237.1 hypothetical protein [Arthrobacter sp. M5]NKR14913.1 hypothetical protein [Arthrobacter sp. M6]OEH62461.1 hypothetical protein A5N13_02060 [Arthrobacter sp. D4]OEH63032.1 hypothetical protein A5N17_10300 [Arthrobacter sp. D2]MDO5865217.1 hypothetical protein [Paenarthrobacter sp. SD-2]